MTDFGTRLQHAREAMGLSRRALSEKAGLATSIVAQIERGVIRSPRGETIVALANALGMPAGELLSEPANDSGSLPPAA